MDDFVFDPKHMTPRWGVGSRFQTLMARIFGRRLEGADGRHTIVGYEWRGRVYVVSERSHGQSD